MRDGALARERRPGSTEHRPAGKRAARSIVVVEPGGREQSRMRQALAGDGLALNIFGDSRKARRFLRRQQPDLIVTELLLGPGDDGLLFLKWLRRQRHHVPVVVSTAYPAYRADQLNWMADSYTVKSDGLGELKQAINRLLPAHAGSRE